jgi:uncharacterized protein YbaP (TraB family)
MRKDIYPLNKSIEEAFEKSSVLAVEANVNDITGMDMVKLMEKAFYLNDDTLEKHVSKNTYELIKKEFEGFGIPAWIINKQKPWFLALTLETLELAKLGFDPDYGIDVHFLAEASGKKKIVELESVDYQVNLLSGFNDSEQETFLLYTLKDVKTLDKEVDSLLRTWKNGDTKGMEALITKSASGDSRMASMYEKLLYERNRNMVSKIEDFLMTQETHFVIVGAGHLVGEKGIIELLRKKGYLVEQM